MAENDVFLPTGVTLSSSQDIDFCVEGVSVDAEQVRDPEVSGDHLDELCQRTEFHDKTLLQYEKTSDENGKEFAPPAVGMEFETYDDAYNYYICYAKEVGFRVRVKNSWFKRNTKEKYGAVLCCSSQGFKRIKEVNRLRKETRTGCPAMIRMRLMDSKRWRVLEVSLDHNHLLGSKLFKKKDVVNTKRKFQVDSDDLEVRKVKLYKALVIDTGGDGCAGKENTVSRKEVRRDEHPNQLLLRKGDSQAIYNYLCRMQLTNPNFFYLMDFSEEGGGYLKNVFWIDARSREACCYFGDVLFVDSTYLVGNYEVPLVGLVGVNNHGQSVLLGCGLLSGESTESYTWLFKAWLKCNSGCSPPCTIITDWSMILQIVVSEVFPGSQHCFSVSHIMRRIPEKLGGLQNYEAIRKALNAAVYETSKVMEFEASWSSVMRLQQLGGAGDHHEWLKSLYEERARWVPVYLKDVFLAGIGISTSTMTGPGGGGGEMTMSPFFDKYIYKQTPLKEFLDKYELALHKKHKEESCADIESRTCPPILKTRCPFEKQLSRVYTREIFQRFQVEVEEMYSCFSTTQVQMDGGMMIFLVKERFNNNNNNRSEIRDFEVVFNLAAAAVGGCEVRCICRCFKMNGYLCRHALSVLNFNGVEEIPAKYVLSRWKKDYKRLYVDCSGKMNNGEGEKVVWFNQLYRSAMQVVEEGVVSVDHYNVTLKVLEESLSKVHDVSQSCSRPEEAAA